MCSLDGMSIDIAPRMITGEPQWSSDVPGIRDVIESLLDPYVLGDPVVDPEGSVIDIVLLFANEAACRSFGAPREAAVGGSLGDLLAPEIAGTLLLGLDDVVTTGAPLRIDEHAYTCADGAVLRYDLRATKVGDRLAVTWSDVTDRYEQRHRLELMIANSADVVLFVRDGIVGWVSPGVLELLGWTAEELHGRAGASIVHPADRDRLRAAQSSNEAGHVTLVRLRYQNKSGGFTWCEARARRIEDNDQATSVGTVVSLREITEEVALERERDASDAQYRLVAENASDVVYTTDRSFRINWISPSVTEVMGWRPEEVIGRPTSFLVSSGDRDAVSVIEAQEFSGVTPLTPRNLCFRTRSGAERWMTIRARAGIGGADWIEQGRLDVGIIVTLTDCEAEMVERRAVDTVSAGSRLIAVADDEDRLLTAMCNTAVQVGGYRFAWYRSKGRSDGDLGARVHVASSAAFSDFLQDLTEGGHQTDVDDPADRAERTGAIATESDLDVGHTDSPRRIREMAFGFRSSTSLPVWVDGAVDGVLTVYAAEPRAFDDRAVSVLGNLARTLGVGIERLRNRSDLHQAFVSSIDLVASVVESRDPYTAGHQSLVAELARALGTDLGLDDHRLDGLALAARIHDVGKISIPIDILCRPGKLAPEEMAVVRRHATIGWEIAGHFTWPWPVADIIHQHHEQFDGSGYPQGLHGDEILLEARIVAVADAYQAIASRRPYREALGEERAYEIIVAGSGTQFDPDVVDAFIRVIADGFTFSTTGAGED